MPQFEQVEVFSSLIFWSLISFALLFFVLKRYAFPPIMEALEAREDKIRGDIDSAEKLREEANKIKADLEEQFRTAHDKAGTIVQMASGEAKKLQEKSLEETQMKVRQMLNDAEREIAASRNKLLGEIRSFAANLTVASTEKFLKKSLTDEDRKRLAEESIEEVIREIEQNQKA